MVKKDTFEEYSNFPIMEKLFEHVIPAIAGDQIASFADIIDNSIDAGAKNIYLVAKPSPDNGRKIGSYMIMDDGVGMDKETLIESHRWCTDTPHAAGDLGKFGVGGSTACFSLAKRKTTYTKKSNGKLLKAVTDVDWYKNPKQKAKGVRVFPCTPEEEKKFSEACGVQGTIINLENLRLESAAYTNPNHLNTRLIKEYSVTFGRLLNHHNLFIGKSFKEAKKVEPRDPFYNDNSSALLYNRKVDYELATRCCDTGEPVVKKFNIEYKILNHQIVGALNREDSSYDAAGIWLYRKDRLIGRAIRDKRLYSFNTALRSVRIVINIGNDMDSEIQVSATKNRFQPTQAFVDEVLPDVKILRLEANKLIKTNTDTEDLANLHISHKNMEDKLAKAANILNLPKTEEGVRYRNAHGDSQGTVEPTGTGEKRVKKSKSEVVENNKRNAIVPKFEIVSLGNRFEPGSAFEYDWDGESMVILINQDHPWTNQKYINGTAEVQKVLQELWSSECIAEFNTMGVNNDEDYKVVKHARHNTSKHLITINSL